MKHPSFISLAQNDKITSEKTTTTDQIFSLIKVKENTFNIPEFQKKKWSILLLK